MTGVLPRSEEAADGEAPGARSVTAVVGLLVLFELVSGILQTGIGPLLPAIGDRFAVSDATVNWVVSVQLLAAAVCVPAFGRLGDLHGHRRMLRIALVSVAAGSVIVAAAPSFPVLLAGRVLQGPLAALLPLEIALVRDRLPTDLARRAIARLVGALTLGGLLGGVGLALADKAFGDVRMALWLAALLAVVCVPVSFVAVPESARRADGRVDWPGVVLLSLSMIALLGGVGAAGRSGWGSAATLLPVLAGLLLLAVWTVVELRVREPLVDLRAMAGRRVAPVYLTSFVFGVVFFGSQAPNATFFAADPDRAGYGFGMSAIAISAALLPGVVSSVAGSALAARLAGRLGYGRVLVCAYLLIAAAFAGFALGHGSLGVMIALYVVAGFGIGAALSAMPTVIVEASDPSRSGVATALYNNVKTLGGALAGGVFGTLLASSGGSSAPEGRYVLVWLLTGGCALIATGAVLFASSARVR
ncbi:MFS transporter [Actinomadura rupiterrae]|uniref:MFS transporter n=1 Tax=Actinomadura rupiterrae TaxID=559627 RepID=UPI0020A31A7F|nr:MFS transporter [Actinomadura rupiterrae]MCP2338609.1 MFS family permease [Actinomadura rupiterrae]